MAVLPDLINTDWLANNKAKAKELIEYAVDSHKNQKGLIEKMISAQDKYNGLFTKKEVESITRTYGRESKTPFVMYRIGQSKLNRLMGEFLRIGLQTKVYTYNKDATDAKRKELNIKRGRAMSAPLVEEMRGKGIDPYNGAEMPSADDPTLLDEKGYRSKNERVMQKIINHKIKSEHYKIKAKQVLRFFMINSKAAVHVTRSMDGVDVPVFINPKDLIAPTFNDEYSREELPFIGHSSLMTKEQVLSRVDDEEEAIKIRNYFEEEMGADDETVREFHQTAEGYNAAKVYYVEWKTFSDTIFKEEDQYIREVKEKLNHKKKNVKYYEISSQILMKGYMMGDIFFGIGPAKNNAVYEDAKGKLRPMYNYVIKTINSLNNHTNSIVEVLADMERDYDTARWAIRREVRKYHGKAVLFDRAFQNKSYTATMYDLMEEGAIQGDSSADSNKGSREGGIKDMLQSFDLGGSAIVGELIQYCMDIERITDFLTGFNDARQGLEKANATATTNQNNLESSRAATYEIFDAVDEFMVDLFALICNKVKINDDYIENVAKGSILTDEETKVLEDPEAMMFDSFGAYLFDSKKEMAVRNAVEMFIPQEINAGKLSVTDFGKYALKDTLDEALEVLEQGRSRLEAIEKENRDAQLQQDDKRLQAEMQDKRETREDKQLNEKDNIGAEHIATMQEIALKESLANAGKVQVADKNNASSEKIAKLNAIVKKKEAKKTN